MEIAYDPYEDVDWDSTGKYNFVTHNHTNYRSDEGHNGYIPPHVVIDYWTGETVTVDGQDWEARIEADIVSFNDHQRTVDQTVWPYDDLSSLEEPDPDETGDQIVHEDYEDRDPENLGIIAIEGLEVEGNNNELEHHGGYDTPNLVSEYENEYDIVEQITDDGGYVWMYHPAAYGDSSDYGSRHWHHVLSDFDDCLGFEAVSNNYPDGRGIWDASLADFSPSGRFVAGFAGDDLHRWHGYDVDLQFPMTWNNILMDESDFDPSDQSTSRDRIFERLKQGAFVIKSTETDLIRRPHDGDWESPEDRVPPEISSISVDESEGTITIDSPEFDEIRWISNSGVVHTGAELDYQGTNDLGSFVRAEVHADSNPYGFTATQAWYLESDDKTRLRYSGDGRLNISGDSSLRIGGS